MSIVTKVSISRFAEKQMPKLPSYIHESLMEWIHWVEEIGILEVRKSPGYHDEPLKGDRYGQRSVRLNRAYRVFYIEKVEGIEIVVVEVNKHGY